MSGCGRGLEMNLERQNIKNITFFSNDLPFAIFVYIIFSKALERNWKHENVTLFLMYVSITKMRSKLRRKSKLFRILVHSNP